jgi:hypothetical protein
VPPIQNPILSNIVYPRNVATNAGEHLRHSFQVGKSSPRLVFDIAGPLVDLALIHKFANIQLPVPESGIINLQRNGHLSAAEHSACAVFRSVQPEARAVEGNPKTLVVSALKKRKLTRRDPSFTVVRTIDLKRKREVLVEGKIRVCGPPQEEGPRDARDVYDGRR